MAGKKKVEKEDKKKVKKEVLTAPKMAYQLIGSFIIWGVVLFVPLRLLEATTYFIKPLWLQFLCLAVLEGVCVICMWKLSNHRVFKKRRIRPSSVNEVMKYLIIVTILAVVVCSWVNIRDAKNQARDAVREEFMAADLQVNIFGRLYSEEDRIAYENLKQEYEDKVERRTLVLSIIFATTISLIDLGALYIEKRDLEKRAQLDVEGEEGSSTV